MESVLGTRGLREPIHSSARDMRTLCNYLEEECKRVSREIESVTQSIREMQESPIPQGVQQRIFSGRRETGKYPGRNNMAPTRKNGN